MVTLLPVPFNEGKKQPCAGYYHENELAQNEGGCCDEQHGYVELSEKMLPFRGCHNGLVMKSP